MSTCIKCKEKATKTYHPLQPMCEKHYLDIIKTVNLICNAPTAATSKKKKRS